MDVDKIVEERDSKYGGFECNSKTTQAIKEALAKRELPYYIKEALDMIAHKMARVVCGDPMYEDNFVDIIGYAQLALDMIRREKEMGKTQNLFAHKDFEETYTGEAK